MTMYLSSYDTTAGSSEVTKHITNAIKESFIRDVIYTRHLDLITSLNYKPVFITGEYSSESNIPFFIHPILIENYKSNNFICCDIRQFIRFPNSESDMNNEFVVRNTTEYNLAINRVILNMAWLTTDVNELKLNLSFAGNVFAAWLSETIAKRFALDPRDQMILSIISHFYYQTLFFSGEHIEEEMLQKFAVHTIKATKAPNELVFEVFDKIKNLTDVHSYCENVKNILENVRLEDFNTALLITMIGNTWFGTNASRLLAVALEHPPTWMAIVNTALSERTFKNSLIARIAERYGKNSLAKDFLEAFKVTISDYKNIENHLMPELAGL